MKFSDLYKNATSLEIALFLIFVVYLIFPIQTPAFMAGYVDSPLGMAVLFIVTIYLFFYSIPILGVLYIFVAYELLRRSSVVTGRTNIIKYTPSQEKKDVQMQAMNPPKDKTLEEDMVEKMNPLFNERKIVFEENSFKPVADKVEGSMI